MRATRLSVANYNTTLSSGSLESGTGSSNSLAPPTSPGLRGFSAQDLFEPFLSLRLQHRATVARKGKTPRTVGFVLGKLIWFATSQPDAQLHPYGTAHSS
jgi:hypothetical protein